MGHEVVIVADPHEPGAPFLRAVAGASWGRPFVACDIAVVDLMNPTIPFVESVRRNAKRTVVFVGAGWSSQQDIADIADLLVFQTGFEVHLDNPKVISGGPYLVLAPEYAQEPPDEKTKDVLIVCGGGVPLGFSASLADAMSAVGITGSLVVAPQHLDDISVHGWDVVRRPMSLWPLQSVAHIQAGTMGMSAYESMAVRVMTLLKRLGVHPEVLVVGGVAKDAGFMDALSKKLGVAVSAPEDPEYACALGAALAARGT